MYRILLGVTLLLALYSCGDSTEIGADIVDGGKVQVDYVDDFDLKAKTIKGAPLKIKPTVLYSTYLVGHASDNNYGEYSSSAVFAIVPSSTSFSGWVGGSVDSMVLTLPYDTLGYNGDTASLVTFELRELQESFIELDSISSDKTFEVNNSILGSTTTRAYPSKKIKVYNTRSDSLETSHPQLRLRLSDAFANKIFSDTTTLKDDALIKSEYKGFVLSTDQATQRFVSLKIRDAKTAMILYYTDKDGKKQSYRFSFRNNILIQTKQNITNSKLEQAIVNGTDDDYLYLQGLDGCDIEVTLPDLTKYKDKVINVAYLDLFVAKEQQLSQPLKREISRSVVTRTSDGKSIYVQDISKIASSDDINARRNGNLGVALNYHDGAVSEIEVDGKKIERVRYVVSDFVKNVIDGKVSNSCVIKPVYREETSGNMVFYNTNHSTYPASLKIVFTD